MVNYKLNKIVKEVTENIAERSSLQRKSYLERIKNAQNTKIRKDLLSCGNLAHAIAGCNLTEKREISSGYKPNIGIVSAYNDMLSAHKPYENYPLKIKKIILDRALQRFFEIRETPGLKKKPSTSEVLDWLKLLLTEDIDPSELKNDGKNLLPKLHGALLKNEQDIQLFERLAFIARGE